MGTETISTADAAARLGCSQSYLRDLLHAGRVEGAVRTATRWRIVVPHGAAPRIRPAARRPGRPALGS